MNGRRGKMKLSYRFMITVLALLATGLFVMMAMKRWRGGSNQSDQQQDSSSSSLKHHRLGRAGHQDELFAANGHGGFAPKRDHSAPVTGLRVARTVALKNLAFTRLPNVTRSDTPRWDTWKGWSSPRQLYPLPPTQSVEMRELLHDMATRKILQAKVGFKGTQLKMVLVLEGGQTVVFKPKRYDRDFTIIGTTYSGYDRHNAEIAGFHLDSILGFHRAPPVVGRILNLKTEILPVAEAKLKGTFFIRGDDVCFYGVCMYCKRELAVCAKNGILEGSVTMWLSNSPALRKWRHPYQRTYVSNRKAAWETSKDFCQTSVLQQALFQSGPRLLDITDATVLDYLMGNADRHHYETIEKYGDSGMLLLLDNAKSFGNAYIDDSSILAPLVQCCRIRKSTWLQLQYFHKKKYGNLTLGEMLHFSLTMDTISPVLYHTHLKAVTRRLSHIVEAVNRCLHDYGEGTVLRGASVEVPG